MKDKIIDIQGVTDFSEHKVGRLKDRRYQGYQAKRVIHAYFRIVINTVLSGFAWEFPNSFGTLYIKQSVNTKGDYNFRNSSGGKVFAYNPLNLNKIFSIVMVSEILDNFKYKFKASASFRKKLNRKATSEVCNYRTEL